MASNPFYRISKNTKESHQISPSWVVAFWPYVEARAGVGKKEDKLKINDSPIIVINDAVSVTVFRQKANHIKNANIQLKITDVFYDKHIRPNDWVAIWMCQWEDDANQIVTKLQAGKGPALNGFNSGLKFFGKVRNVSKNVSMSDSGVPDERIIINCSMFNELDMSIYTSRLYETFNTAQAGAVSNEAKKTLLFLQALSPDIFKQFLESGDVFKSPDQMIRFFASIFLGAGSKMPDIQREIGATPINLGNKLKVPKPVFKTVLGSNSDFYIDNMYFYTGVEKFESGDANNNLKLLTPVVQSSGPFFKSTKLKGGALMTSATLDNIPLYSLFNQYLNDVCNEIYTTMRFRPDGGIRPTVVVRQLPFTTPQLDKLLAKFPNIHRPSGEDGSLTLYRNLPRWVIDDDLIKSVNVGYGVQNQVNMVNIFTTPFWSDLTGLNEENKARLNELIRAMQYALGNIIYDEADIEKNGLRAYIRECNFESISLNSNGKSVIASPFWTAMQADFLFNSHLKLNGRVSCVGIQEPICEGDNFEFDGVTYHIEGIEHMCQVFPSGNKKFVTVLTLSNGVLSKALEDDQIFEKHYPIVNIPHTYYRYGLTEFHESAPELKKRMGDR